MVLPSFTNCKGFGQSPELFLIYYSTWKEVSEFLFGHEPDAADPGKGVLLVFELDAPGNFDVEGDEGAPFDGEKLEEGQYEMWLDGKMAIGRLEIVAFAHALHLLGHMTLIFERADVFDDRVGKDNIELLVGELFHISGVAGNGFEVG